jgi:hypothetical protein
MKSLKFAIVEGQFTIHRLKLGTAIPKGITASPFFSISGSEDELSIVAPDVVWMESETSDPGWACIKIVGPLGLNETGIVAGIASALARANISIFSVSTFETNFILVKQENLKKTINTLSAKGHKFDSPPARMAFEDVRTTPALNAYAALIERNTPLIKKLLIEKVGLSTLATMQSEAALFNAISDLHQFMPLPVRLAVNRDIFVSYCIKNLDRILPEVSVPARHKVVAKPK